MRNGRTLLRSAGVLVATAIVGIGGFWSEGMTNPLPDSSGEYRADLIEIDSMERFGELQLPKVVFLHDAHTSAVNAEGKDCATCHDSKDGVMSPKFKRLEDKNATTVQEIYHTGCISCHTELAQKGLKTGPQDGECRSCHNPNPGIISSRQPVPASKSTHYVHVSSKVIKPVDGADVNCGACHHVLDKATDKLVWERNTEDACAACHGDTTVDGVISLQLAAHQQCITCHREVEAKKEPSGPITCAGCHSPEAQANFKVIPNIPRLERGQPNATLILPVPNKTAPQNMKGTMYPVAFDHKAHEATKYNCRTCHHERISSCTDCHTTMGTPESDYVQLSQAMHQPDSIKSCVGCHAEQTKALECAGCHGFIKKTNTNEDCGVCHTPVPGYDTAATQSGSLLTLDEKAKVEIATVMIAERPVAEKPFDLNDIPETVVIGTIADEYEPSEFPHRKIVKAIFDGVSNNKLATRFHLKEGTLCQGCHHNSPASLTPPKCGSCHDKPFDQARGDRPGLKAAFHLQCMGCHDRMQITKPANTDCAGCHKPRAN